MLARSNFLAWALGDGGEGWWEGDGEPEETGGPSDGADSEEFMEDKRQ